MAPKRRMPTRGRPTSPEPDQPPVEPQESVGETGIAPRLVDLFDR